MLYIAHHPHLFNNVVKIGYSTQPKKELRDRYSTYYPYCIFYLWYVDNPSDVEKRVHDSLKRYRLYPRNEIFQCDIDTAISHCCAIAGDIYEIDFKLLPEPDSNIMQYRKYLCHCKQSWEILQWRCYILLHEENNQSIYLK